jgi:hypothetical protein
MEMIETILLDLATRQQFFTVEFKRVTDSTPTLCTVNGIAEFHKTKKAYLWKNSEGNYCMTIRGRIIDSNARTEARADGKEDENTSDAGKGLKYWTVRLDSIVKLVAGGLIVTPNK